MFNSPYKTYKYFQSMLLRLDKKLRRPLTFDQELTQLKGPVPIVQKDEKSHKNYELTLTILDLLIDKSPDLTQSLLIVKKSLGKWYDHVQDEKVAKARQIYNLREKIVVSIRKQVGIVLEEIAYYLRSIMEEYYDDNLERFYAKYLLALKKLEWNIDYPGSQPKLVNKEVQTLIEQAHLQMTPRSRLYEKTSLQTIESPRKRYKQVDMHKYLETREENIELEKQCNLHNRQMGKIQLQMQRLKDELSSALKQNKNMKDDEQKYLEQVQKLSKMLDQMREEENVKKQKERQAGISHQLTKQKYQRFDDFKETIYKDLDQAEEEIKKKEKQANQKNAEEFYDRNYYTLNDGFSDSQPSSSVYLKNMKETQYSSQYRMLLVQAVSLEGYLNPKPQ